jgi:hypothetical protein
METTFSIFGPFKLLHFDTSGVFPVIIIVIISCLWYILLIILFFKVWGMTNDIRKLKNKFAPENFSFEIRKNIALANREKTKEFLLERFFKQLNGETNFLDAKKQLENDLEKIDAALPENLKNVNSYKEFYELFS